MTRLLEPRKRPIGRLDRLKYFNQKKIDRIEDRTVEKQQEQIFGNKNSSLTSK